MTFPPLVTLLWEVTAQSISSIWLHAHLLDVDRQAIINQRLGLFISPHSQTTFNNFFKDVFTSGDKEVCEVTLNQKGDSPPQVVHLEAIIDASVGQREACRVVLVDISERKQAEDLLREQSTHDGLTGLYNRSFFMTELSRFERGRNFPLSIVVADVDQLKSTNDQYGHAAGDIIAETCCPGPDCRLSD